MNSISVVIPAYNSELTILKCLDSVVFQTIKPSEIIIVDDESCDKTGKIVCEYIKKSTFSDICYYKLQKNSGPSFARNFGIEKAKSNWILFLDADDEFKYDRIEKLLSYIEMYDDANIIFSKYQYSNGTITPGKIIESIILINRSIVPRCLMFIKSFIATPAVAINKKINLRFNNSMKYCEDLDFWLRISVYHDIYYHNVISSSQIVDNSSRASLSFDVVRMKKNTLYVLSGNCSNVIEKSIFLLKKIYFLLVCRGKKL